MVVDIIDRSRDFFSGGYVEVFIWAMKNVVQELFHGTDIGQLSNVRCVGLKQDFYGISFSWGWNEGYVCPRCFGTPPTGLIVA